MPGKKITDHQVQKYKHHHLKLSQVAAAAKAGIMSNDFIVQLDGVVDKHSSGAQFHAVLVRPNASHCSSAGPISFPSPGHPCYCTARREREALSLPATRSPDTLSRWERA